MCRCGCVTALSVCVAVGMQCIQDVEVMLTTATSVCWPHFTAFSSLGSEEGMWSSKCCLQEKIKE